MATTLGRPKQVLELTDGERAQLQGWTRRRRTAQGLALRSQIVLECANGHSNRDVASRLSVSAATVGKWRRRFLADRLDGLVDEPRSGRPRTVGDERVEDVIVKTLETAPPDGGTHWSTRQMAAKTGLSQSTISRVWRAFGLQPHRVEHWSSPRTRCLSKRLRTSSGSTWTHPSAQSCCVLTRRVKYKHWTAPNQSCLCCPVSLSVPHTTISGSF